MPDNKLKQFHDSIKGNPNISGVPEDFSRFESALKNPSTSRAFFDAISNNEAIGGLPKDYNTFASSLGIVEKKSSNAPTASSGMGVLLAGKGKAQSGLEELNKEVVKGVVMANINERKELKKREEQAKITDIQFDILAPNTKVLPNFIRSGITSIASGLSYLPGALLDIATSNPVSTTGLAPGSAGSIESPKLTAKDRPKEIDNAVKYFYNLGNDFKGMSEDLMLSSKLKAGIKNPNMDTISQFSNGNFSDGIKSLALETGQTLTQTAAMIAGGAPVIGASMVGSNLGEEINQDGKIDIIDLSQSVGKSIGELYLEKFFNKDLLGTEAIIKGLGNLLTPAGQALKKEVLEKGASVVKSEIIRDLKDVGKKVLEGQKDEILEETAAVGLSFFVDAIDQDKFNVESFKQLGSDMANSALIAATSGGLTSGLAARVSMQKLSRDEKTSIDRLQSVANDETKSQRVRDIALSEINNIRTGAGITASETMGKVSKLPLEKKMEALAIKEELDSVLDDLDGANDLIRERLEPIKADLETKLEKLYTESEMTPEATIQTEVQGSDVDNNETTENTGLYEYNGETYTITNDSISDSSGRLKPTSLIEEVISNGKKIDNQSNEPQGSRVETPISDSLNSVENTTEALGKKDTQFLKKQLGIEANWDMVGEGDVLAGNDPVLAYTKRKLPDWHKESQRGNIDANSKITYDIQRQPATRSITLPSGYVIDGSPELVNKDVAYAKDENGVIIGMIELETFKDGKNGIRHIAVAPEFRGKGVSDKLIEILKENNPQLDLSKTKLRSKGFEKAFGNKVISEAYHKAKSDGSNPELVKAVEDLFATKQPISETPQAEAIVKPVTLQGQVDQLRKDEQAEYDALPDPNDEAARKKIYDRYNKKITPLLKQIEEAGTKSEIIKLDTEASPAVLANEILDIDFSSAEEVSTEKPLTEREQQMITVPQEMPRNSSKFGSWLKSIGEEFDKKTGTNIYKGLKKILTTGDLKAVRAREIVDSEAGVTIDKVKRISTKIQNLIGKDRKSRELANTVMSVDRLDDKISKLAANDNYTAISEILDKKYTPSQIKAAMNYYKNAENGGTSTITKKMFDSIVKDMSGIGAQKIADKRIENAARVKSLVGKILNYDTVGKSQENVVVEPTLISGSQSPMLTGSELAPVGVQAESRIKDVQSSTDRPVSLVDLRTELASMPNGKEILNTLDKSIANQKAAESELSKTEKGRQILEQAKKARELIDSFADWANTSQAANKINKRIGETLAGNKGSYLKRSFRYWKDKKFEPSEAMKLQALESVVDDMMIMELTKLKNSPEYKRLRGDAKRQYLTQIADDVRRKAKIELDTYMDENRQKREDGTGFSINTKAEKIDGKTLSFRKLIDESFLDLLGNVNDPISQFHDTVVSQTQIKSAANFHWILNEVTGKENIYDSREQLVEFNGSSKGFKQINDSNSVLDGKWVSEDIYDVISSNAPTKDGTGYLVYRKILSTMRKSKTIYNFFAGWTTNLIGGEVTLAANGIVNNPKKIGKYLINRAKYIKNPEALTADIQKDIDAMKDNGFWSTSVSAGTIKLLDDNYMDMTAYDRGDETARTATRRWIDKAKRFDDNVVRNYSVIDDFTKLVFFREKKDVFSRKLYGKKFDELSKEEQNIVHANVAERGKENIATMSRLPRIYHKIAKYPLGDFMAFRISAIKSGINTINNARRDIEQGYNKDLSPEQRKAYLEDAFKTLAGMSTAAILNSSLYGAMSTLAMGLMSDDDEEVFNPVVEDGVDYGSKSELYTDFKGTPSVNPQWMRGKNNVVIKDDGKGNIELLNISNKDPYDELFGLFLPRAGTSWDETLGGVLMETISPNMTVNLLMNIKNGEDQWGRSIFTGDDTTFEKGTKIAGYVLTEALVPPAIKNTAKETYKEIQQSKAVEGDTKKEINKKTVGGGEYFNALLKNTPMLLNRTYKVNLEEQFGYYAKEFYQARPEKFGDLDKSGKEKRYEDLKRIKDGYEYLKRYSILNKNSDFLDTATEQMFEKARGISDEEQNYILYGEKVY